MDALEEDGLSVELSDGERSKGRSKVESVWAGGGASARGVPYDGNSPVMSSVVARTMRPIGPKSHGTKPRRDVLIDTSVNSSLHDGIGR